MPDFTVYPTEYTMGCVVLCFGLLWLGYPFDMDSCTKSPERVNPVHYADVIMIEMASQITSLAIVYSIVYSDADQRKHQSSASLAFVRRIHRGPVNSPHKWPVTRKMFPFDDVIMPYLFYVYILGLKIDYKIMNVVSFSLQDICSGKQRTFPEWTQAKYI